MASTRACFRRFRAVADGSVDTDRDRAEWSPDEAPVLSPGLSEWGAGRNAIGGWLRRRIGRIGGIRPLQRDPPALRWPSAPGARERRGVGVDHAAHVLVDARRHRAYAPHESERRVRQRTAPVTGWPMGDVQCPVPRGAPFQHRAVPGAGARGARRSEWGGPRGVATRRAWAAVRRRTGSPK